MSFFRGISGFGVLDPCSWPVISQKILENVKFTCDLHVEYFVVGILHVKCPSRVAIILGTTVSGRPGQSPTLNIF